MAFAEDVEMDDAPVVVTHHHKGKKYAKRGCRVGEEVDGNDVGQVIVQKGSPGLRWWIALPKPILTHGCFRHRVTQQRELGLDPRDASTRILL